MVARRYVKFGRMGGVWWGSLVCARSGRWLTSRKKTCSCPSGGRHPTSCVGQHQPSVKVQFSAIKSLALMVSAEEVQQRDLEAQLSGLERGQAAGLAEVRARLLAIEVPLIRQFHGVAQSGDRPACG